MKSRLGPNISGQIHPDFSKLRDFVQGLPHTFHKSGIILMDHRNILKLMTLPQGEFVVKYFKGMYFFNRLAYSFIRKSKAERSYKFSERLNSMGVLTPTPVAWMDIYQRGLLKESYFISRFYNEKTLWQLLEDYSNPENKTARQTLLHDVASLAFDLHRKGIYHGDFGAGNLLVRMENGQRSFSMVDLNRVKFGRVSYRKGISNFSKLHLATEEMNSIISKYAQLNGQPADKSIALYWRDFNVANSIRTWRRAVRKYTLTPVEKLFKNKS
ncbi:MAG TPA: lipopolysaccharide kinase InaA family protein [Cyclobacteriaceae bacterium]|nr:lipopolysaccharide kinase InaA family protein [Cyclobacteriaceae bacterium]